MSGYIKYFDNDGKNVYFKIEDDNVLVKYIDIWNKIKEKGGQIYWWWVRFKWFWWF